MDEHTYSVRFESMRKLAGAAGGGGEGGRSMSSSSRRQLLITHAELGRQCRATVRGYEFDNRMSSSQLKRERKEVEARLAKIKVDQHRIRKEKPRTRASLENEYIRHEYQKISRLNRQREIERSETEERELDVDDLLGVVEVLPLPLSVKKHLEETILAGEFKIKI